MSCSLRAAEPWQKASWIWDNPSDQSTTPRHFRFVFEVAGDVKSARAWVVVDDRHTCFVNGQKVGERPSWQETGKYDIGSKLHKGKNAIAIEAINNGGPGGLIAWIEVVGSDDKTTVIGSGGQWFVSTDDIKDWANTDFDASKWMHPQVIGGADMAPYSLTNGGPGYPVLITSAGKPLVDVYQSAEEELKQFVVPEGYKVELLAAEPQLINPVSLALDEKGRMFFGESHTYRYGPDGSPIKPFTNPIVMLNPLPDGKGYERVVVAEGFDDPCMGLLVKGGKLWATSDQFLYQFDLGPDGKATTKKTLLTDKNKAWNPFGFFEIEWGPDGLLYMSIGDHEMKIEGPTNKDFGARGHSGAVVRMKPDGSDLELLDQGFRVPYAFEFDPFGQLWQLSNGEGNPDRYAKIIDGVDYHCFTRDVDNDWLAGKRPLSPPVIQRPRGAATSLLHYYGDAFPKEMRGAQLLVNWGPHGFGRVNHTIDLYKPDEHGNVSGEAQQWLGCDDPHFRPTALLLAPDGNILIADWYGRDDESDKTGRIWKLSYIGADPMSKSTDLAVKKASEDDAALSLLDSPSRWQRELAADTLVRLGSSVVGKLAEKAASDKDSLGGVGALWALARIGTPDALTAFAKSADNSDWRVRRLGLILAKRYHAPNQQTIAAMLVDDRELSVRIAASIALATPDAVRAALVKALSAGAAEDKHLRYEAALHLAKNAAPGTFSELLKSGDENIRLTGLIALDIALYEKFPSSIDALTALTDALASPGDVDVAELVDLALLHRNRLATDRAKPTSAAIQTLLSRPNLQPAVIAKLVLLLRSLAPEAPIGGAAKSALDAIASGEVQLKGGDDLLAAFDLLTLENNAAFSLSMIDRSLRHGDDRVRAAANALAIKTVKSDPKVAPTVWKYLADRGTNPFQRMELLATASAIGADPIDEKAWEGLLKEPDPAFARDAVRAWRQFKGNAGLTSFLVGAAPGLLQKDATLKEDLAFTLSALGASGEEMKSLNLEAPAPSSDPSFRDDVLKRPDEGDRSARLGQQVFARVGCIKCHSAGTDTKLGPPLAGIGVTQTREYLLESILEPSKIIKTGFETEVVQTTDGKTYSGLVHAEGDHLIIRTAAAEDNVPLSKIKLRRVQKISIMPTDLEKAMSRAELADLLAYLKSLKTAPKN